MSEDTHPPLAEKASGGILFTQSQLSSSHPLSNLEAPDDTKVWLIARSNASTPTVWSDSSAGCISDQGLVYEVYYAVDKDETGDATVAATTARSLDSKEAEAGNYAAAAGASLAGLLRAGVPLTLLKLQNNRLNDQAANDLAQALQTLEPPPRLRRLLLQRNRIGDRGLDELSRF